MASFLNCLACSSDSLVADIDDDVPTDFEIQYTTTVPSEFFQVASQQGTIELVEYDSKDYTSASRPTTHKPVYVYVPYGYDPSQKYVNDLIPAVETRYVTNLESPDEIGILASRQRIHCSPFRQVRE